METNHETRMFILNWTNDEALYEAVIMWGLRTQRFDVTPQTLGRNLTDILRFITHHGVTGLDPIRRELFQGVSDQVLTTMRTDVGDFGQIQETVVGEDLADLLAEYRTNDDDDDTDMERVLRDMTTSDVTQNVWRALESTTFHHGCLKYWGVVSPEPGQVIVTVTDGSHRQRNFTITVNEYDGDVERP